MARYSTLRRCELNINQGDTPSRDAGRDSPFDNLARRSGCKVDDAEIKVRHDRHAVSVLLGVVEDNFESCVFLFFQMLRILQMSIPEFILNVYITRYAKGVVWNILHFFRYHT